MQAMIKRELNNNIHISTGNRKLGDNGKHAFIIFNLPSVITCPQKTAMCEHFCYAKKAERIYPQVLPSRIRNLEESKKDSFVSDMDKWITYYKMSKKYKDKEIFFRWHESGDIYSIAYLSKIYQLARLHPDINFMAYTKSINILASFDKFLLIKPKNLTFRFSIWADTDANSLIQAQNMRIPTYTAGSKDEVLNAVNKGSIQCDCDCTKCKMCYSHKAKQIITTIH